MRNCYENVHMYAHEGTNKILNQQRYLRKETKMITYISDPHSKRPNNETKLNDTKTYSSTVSCEKRAID